TQPLSTRLLYSTLQADLLGTPPAPVPPPTPIIQNGASGVKYVLPGANGSNGRDGALFVPPSSGGSGDPGPSGWDYTNNTIVNATNRPGVEVGSVGGNGGNGGDSYASFWSGRDGGNGGAGGSFTFTNNAQVAASGTD